MSGPFPPIEPLHVPDENSRLQATVSRAAQLRRRRRALGAVAAVAAVVLAVVLPITLSGGSGRPAKVQVVGQPTTTAIPATSATAPTGTSTTTTPTSIPSTSWPEHPLNEPPGSSFATLGGSLYIDEANPTQTTTSEPVLRIDGQTTKIVARSAELPTGQLAAAGQTLWLAPQPTRSGQPLNVIELNPLTLSGPGSVALPGTSDSSGSPLVIAGNSAGLLWVAYGTHLYEIDTAHPAVVAQATASNQIVGLALDSSGRLYDSLSGQAPPTTPKIEQRNSATGALKASATNPSVAGARLVASSTGVWASYRTGLQGASTLYAADTLAVASTSAAPYFAGGMDVYTSLAGNVLWVTTMSNRTCADANTGAVRASESSTNGYLPGVVAVIANHVFASSAQGLSLLQPPKACGV